MNHSKFTSKPALMLGVDAVNLGMGLGAMATISRKMKSPRWFFTNPPAKM